MDIDYQPYLDRVDDLITERPGTLIVGFLLVTGLFAIGLGGIETTAGTEQFAEDIPEQQAAEAIARQFSPSFAPDTGSTQLIQQGENVLARHELIRMLEVHERMVDRPDLRVTETSSAAGIIAQHLDPDATTPAEQRRAIETATTTEIQTAVREASRQNPQFDGLLSTDFNREAASASATVGVVSHDVPAGIGSGAGASGESPMTPIQEQTRFITDSVGGDIQVFGVGIVAAEFAAVIGDTLILVVPAAVILITVFLLLAYRDLADLLLGIIALLMAIIWTFGFVGLVGIPFTQVLISVPPLLLAVGIDFGIHAVNRYREERIDGYHIDEGMRRATDQVVVAFFIVTGTTVIGFGANLSSQLAPLREFGIVAAIGIVFTFFIFGIFLPAAKVKLDHARQRYPIPTFATTPFGQGNAQLDRVHGIGVTIANGAPVVFLAVILIGSGFAGVYATGVDTTFDTDDFLPPEEPPGYYDYLPEQIQPDEYTVTRTLAFLEDNFETSQDDVVTLYIEGPLQDDYALEALYRAGENPPDSFVTEDGHADTTSIVTIIQDQSARDPEFREIVTQNDVNNNGVPDRNLPVIYDYLLTSPARGQTLQYLTEDQRSARIVYAVEADASQATINDDAWTVANRHRFAATPTGDFVVFQAISDLILQSALVSLTIALIGAAIFLVGIYWLLLGRPSLGVVNLVPVAISVTILTASMRALGLSFDAFSATILAITIGLGIDYSVHITHRFADEYEARNNDLTTALNRTVHGTGGALTGSVLTTVFGIGVLVLSIFPAIGRFGLLTGLSVFYAYLAAMFILPSVLVIWVNYIDDPPHHGHT